MTVRELRVLLETADPDARVLFDTEAARFNVHMVEIDSAYYEDGKESGDLPMMTLHTECSREY